MEEEEVLREHMNRTRESLTNRLENLENKLVSSVEDATAAVRDTVCSVKESMHEGVETVREAVDIPAHARRHPWLMFGAAVVGGYVLANLVERGESAPLTEPISTPVVPGAGRGGWLRPGFLLIKGLAVGAAFGMAREILAEKAPPHLVEPMRGLIDGLTTRCGGTPIARTLLPFPRKGSDRNRETPVVILKIHSSDAHTKEK